MLFIFELFEDEMVMTHIKVDYEVRYLINVKLIHS